MKETNLVPNEKLILKAHLKKLDKKGRKIFYSLLVHYWVNYKYFISKENFLELWRQFNCFCYNKSDNFPDPYDYDNIKEVKRYCHEHPYYFIDILTPKIITNLFAEYLDDKIDVLSSIVQKLYEEDIRAACTYVNETLDLEENVDELVTAIEEHLKTYS